MKIFLTFLVIFSCSFLFSQQYTSAIGIKGGSVHSRSGFGGLNFKHFLGGSNAIELTASAGTGNFRLQALYEWQKSTGWEEGLDWYVGVGGGLGTWRKDYWGGPGHGNSNYSSGFFLRGVAVIGLDYTFSSVPINLALDTGPSVGIINTYSFGWGGGFAIRYVLK